MKKSIIFFVFIALSFSVLAQPQKISYQSVIRNSSGQLVSNYSVGMKISILQGSAAGTSVYVETQTPTTNANGLATIEIGGGSVVSGAFAEIDWSSGTFFVKTETDPAGGTDYTVTGTSQILSVPFAFYSKSAETAVTKEELKDVVSDIGEVLAGTKVIDIDGNIYNTVVIGSQVWMAENLRTSKYNDGTPVPLVTLNSIWTSLKTGAYCWYNHDSATYEIPYGKLYNFYVASSGKICPKGWHVPNNTTVSALITYLDSRFAADKLKEAGTTHWIRTSINVTNETGFTALPGGARDLGFRDIRNKGFWWTSSMLKVDAAYFSMDAVDSRVLLNEFPERTGFSIRCIRD